MLRWACHWWVLSGSIHSRMCGIITIYGHINIHGTMIYIPTATRHCEMYQWYLLSFWQYRLNLYDQLLQTLWWECYRWHQSQAFASIAPVQPSCERERERERQTERDRERKREGGEDKLRKEECDSSTHVCSLSLWGCSVLMAATSVLVSPSCSAIGPSHSYMASAICPRCFETPPCSKSNAQSNLWTLKDPDEH